MPLSAVAANSLAAATVYHAIGVQTRADTLTRTGGTAFQKGGCVSPAENPFYPPTVMLARGSVAQQTPRQHHFYIHRGLTAQIGDFWGDTR